MKTAGKYVVMDMATEKLYGGYRGTRYIEERHAKSVCTRLNNRGERSYVVLPEIEWEEKHNTLVAVYNNITGDGKTPIYIRKSEVGTCCDPSTELYHCM